MLRLENLTKSYNDNYIFKDFSMVIEKNRITCLLGKSGSGKTTLLNVLSSITDEFKVKYSDFEKLRYSYIFQEPRLLEWYTVYKNLQFVLDNTHMSKQAIHEKIMDSLKMVEMEKYADYYPYQLSGGMAQRVSIARAFVKDFDVLLMDEPFKGLDPTQKEDITDRFLKMWRENRKTVIYVTHDLDEALYMAYDIHVLGEHPTKILYTSRNAYKMNDTERENERDKIWQILRSQI
ncbi:MAG: ABC transporter ATP-binding protein [Clostridia bacterium]|nr:ABC transporter ATP-binding protein [Clostridia bacterium]NLV34503.1 ABC transporter ATP-binding protein [Clostridiaceae bacterium]MDD4501461.1 ABC transporter ATP-binding protein [Clostridia bacterium]HPB17595.1 ABC transporter ATP-binding protein [Clostridia bacterium]HQM96159.1 ABC transporter ATP-binding protein [Clostridia bacterium]